MKLMHLAFGISLAIAATPLAAEEYAGGAIKTMEINGQDVLVGPNDMTLYTFDKDTAGVTNCYDQCAVNWPPAIADAGAMADGDFTLVARTDGTMMWAYKGMPLYYWIKDEKPGDTTGDGVGDVWHTAVHME
jgi:predicted lipoprotein with Yx(FWY)xxD motif